MTAKADFTDEQWKTILEGPPSAGMIVVTASRGGSFRESFAMAKSYSEARKQHGDSELLDEIVSSKPQIDHTRFKSPEELKEHSLKNIREALDLLGPKATPEELQEYKQFILTLSNKVAGAHEEHGQAVSDAEQAAIDEIAQTLGTTQAA